MNEPEQDQSTAIVERLLQSSLVSSEMKSKTNEEIADMMIDHVWAYEDVFSAKADLIAEAIDRLRGEGKAEE